MPFHIVRNDITQMECDAIVNTANDHPTVGSGCDRAIYRAAGYDQLLEVRKEIGYVPEGDVFITPAFNLKAKYIIHAVSPFYQDGKHGEEELLRGCYRKSLKLAAEHRLRSIAFPLISTGGFGYPKEEGMYIAVEEIRNFLEDHVDMTATLVVFGDRATKLGRRFDPELLSYIDRNYVNEKSTEEYTRWDKRLGNMGGTARRIRERGSNESAGLSCIEPQEDYCLQAPCAAPEKPPKMVSGAKAPKGPKVSKKTGYFGTFAPEEEKTATCKETAPEEDELDAYKRKLQERIQHMEDTYSQYLLYLIDSKGMTPAQVYKDALVTKKVFSKIKTDPDYHPNKTTALCLCMGAHLNLDQTRDLLARAGYALSPCDKRDIVFQFYIEHENYDMIDLDITMEDLGLEPLIA